MFKFSVFVATTLAVGLSSGAQASVWEATLDQSNTGGFFPDNTPYLSVLIRDGADASGYDLGGYTATSSDVVFTVSALTAPDSVAGNNYGIQKFSFNTIHPRADFAANGSNFILPDGWGLSNGGNAGGFGKFDIKLGTTGSHRLDSLSFAITNIAGDGAVDYFALSDGNAGEGNFFFAVHLAGFDASQTNGISSSWFAGASGEPGGADYPLALLQPVPVPAALWLLGSGMALFATAGARQKCKA